MKLKVFFDQEYFSFARDYISLYNFENVLMFEPHHSGTYKVSALVDLTNQFISSSAQSHIDGNEVRQKFIEA